LSLSGFFYLFLIYRQKGGKRKLTTLKGSDVAKYRKLTGNYQRFYHARARFLKLNREIIDGLKKIEEERVISGTVKNFIKTNENGEA